MEVNNNTDLILYWQFAEGRADPQGPVLQSGICRQEHYYNYSMQHDWSQTTATLFQQ